MNPFSLLKICAGAVVVIGAYFFGLSQGHDSEQLKNAQAQVRELTETIQRYETKQKEQSLALADLRVAESRSRDDAEWVRQQLSEIERAAKTDADRRYNRCLRLAAEGKELLDRAESAIKFCEENHR